MLQEWWFCRQVLKNFLQRFAQAAQIDVQCKSSPANAADEISEKFQKCMTKVVLQYKASLITAK
ncbi:hypothetical protein N5J23_15440, partial [Comamonas aquatica]